MENEAWQEVKFKYEAYQENLQASLNERIAALYKPELPDYWYCGYESHAEDLQKKLCTPIL